jgi:Cu(I)/Ag(I) efflux system membrane protein CusA/SilA
MLSTGMRSNLGVKVFGPDLEKIEEIAIQIEKVLQDVPGTRSAFAERVMGGHYFDFKINREEAARYGLTVGSVEDIIETAVGGKNIGYTIEGRERYPISVRYPRELRNDIEALGRILIPTPSGAQIPISLLADMEFAEGPPMIRDEDGQLVGYVFVDVTHQDYEGYVREAQQIVSDRVDVPAGYRLEWAGQYQYLERMKQRLTYVIPITLFIIFVLLYINFGSWKEPLIVFLAVPFSLIGSFWLLYLLEYNLSIAVWVGIIALAGLEAEMGVVFLLYLQLAHDKWKKEGRMRHLMDLREAIHYGAVQRLRPKLMTVLTTFIALLPIMWAASYETGADVMKRMAAPMVGGLVTSFFLGLTIYPAVFFVWKRFELEGPAIPDEIPQPESGRRLGWWIALVLLLVLPLLWWLWSGGPSLIGVEPYQVVAQQQVGDIQIQVSAPEGRFTSGDNRFRLTFREAGELSQVETVRIEFYMPAMATMPAMLIGADVSPISGNEVESRVSLPMPGEWQMRIAFDTPAESRNTRINIRAQ